VAWLAWLDRTAWFKHRVPMPGAGIAGAESGAVL
jgi:hypothetical protein